MAMAIDTPCERLAAPPAIAMVLQEDIAEEMEEEVVEEALHCAA